MASKMANKMANKMELVNLRVTEATTNQERMQFVKFPWRVYKGDPYWVPPLIGDRKAMFDPKKNPSFEHMEVAFFLASAFIKRPDMALTPGASIASLDAEVVGTIAAIINHRHNEFHHEQVGFFGFFETINDAQVAAALLDKASAWVAERGMTSIRGPMSFSTNDECGTLIDGFDSSPMLLMTYNPPYYPELIEQAGFGKAMDLFAYFMDFGEARDLGQLPSKLGRVAEKVRKRGEIRLRQMNMKDFRGEVDRFKEIYNHAWEKNWGFIPMTDAEIEHLAQQLKQVIDPDLVWIAEVASGPEQGRVIGVSLTVPDANVVLKQMNGRVNPITILKALYYQRKIKAARVIALGVVEEWRGRGVDALLYYETARSGLAKGYQRGEGSWILENNVMMNRAIQMLGGKVYKCYRIYEKALLSHDVS